MKKSYSERYGSTRKKVVRKNGPGSDKEGRRQRALAREEHRTKLTAVQQLMLLDKRLGNNKGAKKERARLHAILASEGKTYHMD